MKTTKGILIAASLALFFGTSCNEAQEENIESTTDTIGSRVESGLSGIKDEFDDYRDEIHPTPSGLKKIEKAMAPEIRNLLNN